jgi:hypothetical protein
VRLQRAGYISLMPCLTKTEQDAALCRAAVLTPETSCEVRSNDLAEMKAIAHLFVREIAILPCVQIQKAYRSPSALSPKQE